MKKNRKNLKVVGLCWYYTKYDKPCAKDRGPILVNGEIIRLICFRFRTSVIGGWESRYFAIVTEDTEITIGTEGFLAEKELRSKVPPIKSAGFDKAFNLAYKLVK